MNGCSRNGLMDGIDLLIDWIETGMNESSDR